MKRETTPEMYSHQQKENIKDGSNGDIYVNQYHRYKLSGAAGALSLKGTPYQMASEVVQLLKCSLGNIHGVDSKGLFQGLWPRGCCVWTLYKALQRKGHLVEIILPKFDCMQYEHVTDLKALDVDIESCFDGRLYKNKIWVGTVEGLPVYFDKPHHLVMFFRRGQFYGEHDDFKRFSFFSRAALEFLNQVGKRPNIIHCHDWQTTFVDVYEYLGYNSDRLCFTCHNFEYQGTTAASELSSCGLDVPRLKRPDRMEDNSEHDKVNPIKICGMTDNSLYITMGPFPSLLLREKS